MEAVGIYGLSYRGFELFVRVETMSGRMITKLGNYYLEQLIQDANGIRELAQKEYEDLELAGIKRIFNKEKIYHGDAISLNGVIWGRYFDRRYSW